MQPKITLGRTEDGDGAQACKVDAREPRPVLAHRQDLWIDFRAGFTCAAHDAKQEPPSRHAGSTNTDRARPSAAPKNNAPWWLPQDEL